MDTPEQTAAERFGALIRDLAPKAGYDLATGSGGRAALARDTGMSPSAVGRMLDGKTLPLPTQFEAIAHALNVEVRSLLVAAGIISSASWPKNGDADVLSATTQSPLSPEAAADAWGITDPIIRSMLLMNIEQAIRLQLQSTNQTTASTGGP